MAESIRAFVGRTEVSDTEFEVQYFVLQSYTDIGS